MNYSETLSKMKIQSAQGINETYSKIYTRKCINSIVPNIGIMVRREESSRNGTILEVSISKNISNMRRNSLLIRGPERTTSPDSV